MAKLKAVIFDIDGTLANIEHRVKYVNQPVKDWDIFFAKMDKDIPNEWCVEMVNRYSADHTIILCTARPEDYRKVTEQWLKDNNIPFDLLMMKTEKQHGIDGLVKKRMYEKLEPRYDIQFVVDDRRMAVNAWRELGLICLQCADGNF